MVKFSKKLASVIFLALIVFIGALIFFKHDKPTNKPPAQSVLLTTCKDSSSEKLVSCVENFAYSAVQKDPSQAGKILDELWSGEFGVDLRLFSPVAHDLGMTLTDQNVELVSAIKFCGESFKGACAHGAVMEYIDKNFPAHPPATAFIKLCDSLQSQITEKQYGNCVHGIGHELRAKLTSQNEQVVNECNYFETKYRGACASGVLMEASKGNQGLGYHSDSPVGKVQFDCSKVARQYQLICYSSIGSYTQYEADSPSFTKTFQLCSSLQGTPRAYCFAGADERLLMFKNGDINSAIEFCKTLPSDEIQDCLMVKSDSLDSLE